MSRNLNLSVKEQWFDAIENGSKTIEYRDMKNDYWVTKLLDMSKYPNMTPEEVRNGLYRGKLEVYRVPYDTATFYTMRNGKKVHLVIEVRGLNVFKGHTTFAIMLGDLLLDSQGNKPKKKK